MRRRILRACALALVFGAPACVPILGDYELGGGPDGTTLCSEDTQQVDCKADEACYVDHCRPRCSSDVQCGEGHVCAADVCSDDVGRPCETASCAGGSCVDVDANDRAVPKYCTIDCVLDPSVCPAGYTCKSNQCLAE